MSKLPPDLLRVLSDHSIVVPQDQTVFELVASCIDTPTGTVSALTAEEWQQAWTVTIKKLLETEARLDRAAEELRSVYEYIEAGRERELTSGSLLHKRIRAVLAEQEKKQP